MKVSEILPGKRVKEKKKSVVEFSGHIGMETRVEFKVKFLSKSNIGDSFIFPEQENTSVIAKSQTVKILKGATFQQLWLLYFSNLKIVEFFKVNILIKFV